MVWDAGIQDVTSWFVRRKTAFIDAENAAEAKPSGQASKSRQKEQAVAANQQQQQPQRLEGDKGEDKQLKQAAAAAVTPTAAEEKKQKQAAAADERKQKRAAAAEDRRQRREAASSASDSSTDSDNERPSAPRDQQQQQQQQQQQPGHQEQDEQQLHKQQQPKKRRRRGAADTDDEAEDRPRVVAYSDSDSDVESHFARVKHHLLPPSEVDTEAAAAAAEAKAAAEQAAAEAAAAAAEAEAQRARLKRVGTAAGRAAGTAARRVAPHMTAGLAARCSGLLVLGNVRPAAANALGLLGVAAPLAGAAATRAGLDLARLPAPLLAAGHELGQLGKAAAAVAAARLLHAGLQHRRRSRRRLQQLQQATEAAAAAAAAAGEQQQEGAAAAAGQAGAAAAGAPRRLLRRRSSVNLAALAACDQLGAAIQQRQPQTAADWAHVYAAEMLEMRRMLQEMEVDLPPDRFDATNADLLRFAKASGLLAAKSAEQRAAAMEAGVSRVVHTADWARRHRFMSDRELRRWDRLVAWKAHDSCGRPILLARVGRLMQLVKPERYEECSAALLTLVHRGLTNQLSNMAGSGEQMVVVVDCRGGSSMGITRHMGMLKRLAITLNQHYPDRLHRLHLLELPLLLRWALHAVMPMLHPNTRSKVVLSSMADPDLPVTVAFLTKRRSSAATPIKRSLSNCSFVSSGDSTPALLSPQTTHPQLQLTAAGAGGSGGGSGGWEQQQQHPHPQLALPLPPPPRQQQRQLEIKLETEVPGTPPPTLKAPQSPNEAARGRRQLQQQQLGRHGHSYQAAPGPFHPGPQQAQQAVSPYDSAPTQQEGQQLWGGGEARAPWEQQQQQQPAHKAVPAGAAARAAALPVRGQEQPERTHQQAQQQPAAAAASGNAALQPAKGAAAGGRVAAPAASAAAGLVSHAVPWSPGMQATSPPAGILSRDSSFGEQVVPAATAKAAADAMREQQQAAADGTAAAAAGSGTAAAARLLAGRPAISPLPLNLYGSAVLNGSSANPATATSSSSAASSTFAGLSSLLAALLPTRLTGRQQRRRQQEQQHHQQQGLQAYRLHSLPALGGSSSSSSSSPMGTPKSGRRRDGLTELPERGGSRLPLTPGRGRGLTPRKSSLRRSESEDNLLLQPRKLGSHPLRRQSSVSWAEELESIKEIGREGGSPWRTAPLRTRLAAAATGATGASQPQLQLLLTACFGVVMMAALLQRLLLALSLALSV